MIISSLKAQPLYQKISAYYLGMDYREQVMVSALTVFLLAVLILTQIIMPSITFKEQAQQRYQNSLQDMQWMLSNLPAQPANRVAFIGGDLSMIAKVSNAAKATQLTFKRYDNLDESRLRVVIEQQSFKNLLAWLQYLEKNYVISVIEISADKQDRAGFVNARVLLQG